MTAKSIVSGVGARRGSGMILDSTTGLPAVGFNSGTLVAGTLFSGIKTFDYNSPQPQKFTHYGDDNPFAQDSLPPTEVGSFTITTAKTNLTLDAFTEGTKVVSLDTTVKARLGNTNKRGVEPQETLLVYRQALDTDPDSSTFGKLREWHAALIPSTRIVNNLQSMGQGITDKRYDGIPTPVKSTPWGATFDESTWGATRGEFIELVFDYQPVMACGQSNGTLTTFALPTSAVPIDTAHTHVWINGTAATVSAVSTSTTAPSFTVSSVTGTGGASVFAIVETNAAL